MEFPFFPGVLTPTEIEQGLSFGINQFKFFPSEASGGASKLEVVFAPYAHLGVKFIPSGGININNLEEYLVLNQSMACRYKGNIPDDIINMLNSKKYLFSGH